MSVSLEIGLKMSCKKVNLINLKGNKSHKIRGIAIIRSEFILEGIFHLIG